MTRHRSPSGPKGRSRITLGLNAVYHQPSACLVIDGQVVAAAEEERFNRIKGGKETDVDNTLVLPFQSIDYVLNAGGITLDEVDEIANSFAPKRRRQHKDLFRKHDPVLGGGYETPEGDRAFREFINLIPNVIAARYGADTAPPRSKYRWIPHHVCHLASSYYASPFPTAAGLSIDGIGENDSTTIADCSADGIKILERINYPHSLGTVWEVVTNFLGFRGNHDECKIMGLAAYGDPSAHRKAMDAILRVRDDGTFETRIDPAVLYQDYSQMEGLFGMRRRLPFEPLSWQAKERQHADLAAALQEKTNEIFVRLATRVRETTGREYLVMAGGVTLNCVANGLVAEKAGFKDVYIQSAAGDAGTAIGAALYAQYNGENGLTKTGSAMLHPFLGPSYTEAEMEAALKAHRLNYQRVEDPVEICAQLLAEGKVVGWFQGRMEFGPRALGNRSLLANPTLPGIRHVLNLQVKHREEFRPFCPTVLAEHTSEWVEHEAHLCHASRLMLATYKIRPEKRDSVPAVIHLDGSSRAQVLHREDNPLFHDLLTRFHALTGTPMVLNTSFNDREPIVCSPDHACRTWLKTRFDAMILGPFLVTGLKPWERNPELSYFEREAQKFDLDQ